MDSIINLKLVVLGEGGVGKTSLINKYLGQEIPEVYLPTIGRIIYKKEYKISKDEIKLSIWDAGGQRSFNPLNPALYSNIDVAILVFDLTKPKETLKNIKGEFLEIINSYSEDVLTLIVGNKLDLLTKIDQLKAALKKFLSKNDNFILISSKTGENVIECFGWLISTFLKKTEMLYPDIVHNNSIKEFLDLIGKNEQELRRNLVNLTNIESYFQKIKPKSQIEENQVFEKQNKDFKYYDFLKQEIKKTEDQKNNIFDQYLINIEELDNTIKHLQKFHSKSPNVLVDKLKELCNIAKNDVEESVEYINKLNREEFELVRIILKTKNRLI